MAAYVELTLGGEVRQLRLTAAALECLERDLALESFMDLPKRQVSATIVNAILWRAMQWKIPAVTREQVLVWVDEADYATCMRKAIETFGLALETFAKPDPQQAVPNGGTGTPPDVPLSPSA